MCLQSDSWPRRGREGEAVTLFEIIEAVKNNEQPSYEDLRYALLALDSMHTFTSMDLRKFFSMSTRKRHPALDDALIENDFQRQKRILAANPKEWLGWGNDPENPEYRHGRAGALRLFGTVAAKLTVEGKP